MNVLHPAFLANLVGLLGPQGLILILAVALLLFGQRKFRSCKTLNEAQRVKAEFEEKNALKNPTALSDLDELGEAAIRHALEKLKPFDATITEAVDFYVKSISLRRNPANSASRNAHSYLSKNFSLNSNLNSKLSGI